MTAARNAALSSSTMCGMPSSAQASAARRVDSAEQHAVARAVVSPLQNKRKVTPTQSAPCSTSNAAAAAESTPPLIATQTRPLIAFITLLVRQNVRRPCGDQRTHS